MKKSKEFTKELNEDSITVFSSKPNTDWCKAVMKVKWNGKSSTVDIRNIKMSNEDEPFIGKGISLTPEDTDALVDTLISQGYGNMEIIEKELSERKSMYDLDKFKEDNMVEVVINE